MEKNQIWTVIGVALVVAIVASIATVSLTGNVVKVTNLDSKACIDSCSKNCTSLPIKERASCRSKCTQSCVKADVYTKEEIDTKLIGIEDEIQDLDEAVINGVPIYNLFNNGCVVYSVANPNATREVSGDTICQEREAGICVFTVNSMGQKTVIERCGNSWPSDEHVAYCCKIK